MNILKKCARPACIYLVIVLLAASTSYQSASAAMLGTENFLAADRGRETHGVVHQLPARQDIQSALVAQGVDPQQAELWLKSLTDAEITIIARKYDDLAAGSGVFIFSMIIIAVIAAAFAVFNYTHVTDVFP